MNPELSRFESLIARYSNSSWRVSLYLMDQPDWFLPASIISGLLRWFSTYWRLLNSISESPTTKPWESIKVTLEFRDVPTSLAIMSKSFGFL